MSRFHNFAAGAANTGVFSNCAARVLIDDELINSLIWGQTNWKNIFFRWKSWDNASLRCIAAMHRCCSYVSWMSCSSLSCSSSLALDFLFSWPLLLFPPPPPYSPLPRPIMCMSSTPHARALSDRPPPRCRDWPRASFSATHCTPWPRRRPRPPAFHSTPTVSSTVSHAHTCTLVDVHCSHVYTAAHVHDTCTLHMHLCLYVFIWHLCVCEVTNLTILCTCACP